MSSMENVPYPLALRLILGQSTVLFLESAGKNTSRDPQFACVWVFFKVPKVLVPLHIVLFSSCTFQTVKISISLTAGCWLPGNNRAQGWAPCWNGEGPNVHEKLALCWGLG